MKRLGILFLVLLLLAGCQPTPEVDAVRQKNSAKMIEMARGEADSGESAAPEQAAAQEAEAQPEATAVPVKALVPERLQWDFYTDVKNIHVTADVPIRIRTEDTVPLLRMEPWTRQPQGESGHRPGPAGHGQGL